MKKRIFFTGLALITALAGMGSLVYLSFFLFIGDTSWISIGNNSLEKLMWDAGLCLAFFLQHSLMIRHSFKRWIHKLIPEIYHKAFYSIASGCVLTGLVILWQPVPHLILTVPAWLEWCFYSLLFFTGLVILFCSRVMSGLELFGLRPLIEVITDERQPRSSSDNLVIKGPYRWIRHPLYMSFLIIAWATPRITPDRLLFNILWTLWVYFATHLEEKDLIACFGESYREYRQKVPMIVPRSIRPRM